jgi:serine/threonine protein kinase
MFFFFCKILGYNLLNFDILFQKIWDIFSQFLLALGSLKQFNIIHRDIKGKNVFIAENGTMKLGLCFKLSWSIIYIVLGDFGLSRELSSDLRQAFTLRQGTRCESCPLFLVFIVFCSEYMAPEMLAGGFGVVDSVALFVLFFYFLCFPEESMIRPAIYGVWEL